jgi:hypothetical protein
MRSDHPSSFSEPPADGDPFRAADPIYAPGEFPEGRGKIAGGTWASEEIAEINRRCLVPGDNKNPDEDPLKRPLKSPRESRRLYIKPTRGTSSPEYSPLEPPIPWSSFFALVTGLCAAFMAGPLYTIAVCLAFVAGGIGIYALYEIYKGGFYVRGTLSAVAGIVLGIGFATYHTLANTDVLVPYEPIKRMTNSMAGKPRALKFRALERDFQRFGGALDHYHRENTALPPGSSGSLGANAEVDPQSPSHRISTFRIHSRAYDTFHGLTTPVAYLSHYPEDPYAPGYRATYGYYPSPDGRFVLLFSPGPDGVYDVNPETDFRPGNVESRDTLLLRRFDPTNGASSKGDIWFVYAAPARTPDPFDF